MFKFCPKIVKHDPYRVCLVDGDVIAYQGSYGRDTRPEKIVASAVDDLLDRIKDDTGAGTLVIYLTGKENFRNDVACLQQYKGNRYHPDGTRKTPQPLQLQYARDYLIEQYGAELQPYQEADDALTIAQTAFNKQKEEGGKLSSIISTIDKDLRICPGRHHNIGNQEIDEVTRLGELCLKIYETGNISAKTGKPNVRKKLIGSGLSFFYAQLLMGDTTDNIPGLPKVTTEMAVSFGIRRGGCGEMAAYNVLKDCCSEYELFKRVLDCYTSYWEDEPTFEHTIPKHWKTNEVLDRDPLVRMQEQAQLVWMRTYPGEMWEPPKHLMERYNEEKI